MNVILSIMSLISGYSCLIFDRPYITVVNYTRKGNRTYYSTLFDFLPILASTPASANFTSNFSTNEPTKHG